MRRGRLIVIPGVLLAAVALLGCGASQSAAIYAKPGFHTEIQDGRLWVFREGSKELEEFKNHRELAQPATRIGAGPKGMTIKAPDVQVIDEYLSAKYPEVRRPTTRFVL